MSTYPLCCRHSAKRNPAGFSASPGAFVFSLVNYNQEKPIKLDVHRRSGQAIYNHYEHGPTFGGGYDIGISDGAGSNTKSVSDLGFTYHLPYGYTYKSAKAQSFLAGSYNFQPSDMEVFYEILDPGK